MAFSISLRRHLLGLAELLWIRLIAASKHRLPYLVAQPDGGLKVGTSGKDRIADLNTDRCVALEHVAAQYRPSVPNDAGSAIRLRQFSSI
jgi:hypothetical protein